MATEATMPGFLTSELYPKDEHSPQPGGARHRENKSVLCGLSSTGRSLFQALDNWIRNEFLKAFLGRLSKCFSLSLAWQAM